MVKISEIFNYKNRLTMMLFFLIIGIAYGHVQKQNLEKDLMKASDEISKQSEEHLGAELRFMNQQRELQGKLSEEKNRNDSFEDQIGQISSTVGTLTKLKETDKELLQKYSKVYFLNEHYIPKELSTIPSQYTLYPNNEYKIHSKVLPFLTRLLDDAKKEGITIEINSAYRSFYEQASIKSSNRVVYGSGSNKFSADQGYSEHQLGTTVDFSFNKKSGVGSGFEKSLAYKWLTDNAYKYGFVLSYPEKNQYYVFEPWHWRFVGSRLAERIHEDKKYFYDLDQRNIDEYLVNIFD